MKLFIVWLFFLVMAIVCLPFTVLGFFFSAAKTQFKIGYIKFEDLRVDFVRRKL